MGNNNCKNICMNKLHIDFKSITNNSLTVPVIKLQALVRAYIIRKRTMRMLFNIHRQNWDIIFKNVNMNLAQFDERYLKQNLKYLIINFYQEVFRFDTNNKKYLINENNYNFKNPHEFMSNFKPLILLFMNKHFYLGKIRKVIKEFTVEYEIDDNLFDKFDTSDDGITFSDDKMKTSEVSYTNITIESHRLTYSKRQSGNNSGSILNTAKNSSNYVNKNNAGHIPIRNEKKRETKKLYNNFFRDNLMNFNKFKLVNEASTKEEEYNHTIPSMQSTLNSQNEYMGRVKLIDSQGRLVYMTNLEEISSESHCVKTAFDRENGIYYNGYWNLKSRRKSNFGLQYSVNWANGVRYKYMGYFKAGLFHGYGILVREDGFIYQGEFRDGKQNGFGIEIINEKVYQGFFYDGLYHGYGEVTINGKEKFKGCFNMGMKDDIGFTQNDDGTAYIGNYKNGKVNEFGAFLWKEGHIYYGQWKNGKMEGRGKFKWVNGDLFIGYYSKDLKNGEGEYYFSEQNSILKGTWQMGNKHGKFRLYKGGEKFTLIYKNDQQVA
jgi:hypothetical protein